MIYNIILILYLSSTDGFLCIVIGLDWIVFNCNGFTEHRDFGKWTNTGVPN